MKVRECQVGFWKLLRAALCVICPESQPPEVAQNPGNGIAQLVPFASGFHSLTCRPESQRGTRQRLPQKTKNDRCHCSHTSGACAMADSLLVHRSTRITVHAESVSRDTIHTLRSPLPRSSVA